MKIYRFLSVLHFSKAFGYLFNRQEMCDISIRLSNSKGTVSVQHWVGSFQVWIFPSIKARHEVPRQPNLDRWNQNRDGKFGIVNSSCSHGGDGTWRREILFLRVCLIPLSSKFSSSDLYLKMKKCRAASWSFQPGYQFRRFWVVC